MRACNDPNKEDDVKTLKLTLREIIIIDAYFSQAHF